MSERIDEIESRLRELGAPARQEQEEPSPDGDVPAEPVADEPEAEPVVEPVAQHAAGDLHIPEGYGVLSGSIDGRRATWTSS